MNPIVFLSVSWFGHNSQVRCAGNFQSINISMDSILLLMNLHGNVNFCFILAKLIAGCNSQRMEIFSFYFGVWCPFESVYLDLFSSQVSENMAAFLVLSGSVKFLLHQRNPSHRRHKFEAHHILTLWSMLPNVDWLVR